MSSPDAGRLGLRIALIAPLESAALAEAILGSEQVADCRVLDPEIAVGELDGGFDALVVRADRRDSERLSQWLKAATRLEIDRWIVITSAEINEPRHGHPGLASESSADRRRPINRIAKAWREIESVVRRIARTRTATALTLLRPPTLVGDRASPLGRLLHARCALIVAGHDPAIQVLSASDLSWALRFCLEQRTVGTFNLAPTASIPLRRALKRAGRLRLPLPHWLHRLGRTALRALGLPAGGVDALQYARYSWTVSAARLRHACGFTPHDSSWQALPDRRGGPAQEPPFDEFGQNRPYIRAFGRTLFPLLHDLYWRIEARGLEHVPDEGGAVLVGLHRGFMPFDGVMMLHLVRRERNRYIRFLVHPTLLKQPYLANFMTRLGGVAACRENADWVLERGGLVGIYPEGIRGAFSLYREAYELKSFGRSDFVRIALRNRVPIVPFVTVGSAEIFPILGRLDWEWWRRNVEWPFLPITPTFPWLPVPLPSKWHTRFLEPIHLTQRYPPEAADDHATVQEISLRVQALMGETLATMCQRRRHVFFGSLRSSKGVSE